MGVASVRVMVPISERINRLCFFHGCIYLCIVLMQPHVSHEFATQRFHLKMRCLMLITVLIQHTSLHKVRLSGSMISGVMHVRQLEMDKTLLRGDDSLH